MDEDAAIKRKLANCCAQLILVGSVALGTGFPSNHRPAPGAEREPGAITSAVTKATTDLAACVSTGRTTVQECTVATQWVTLKGIK